MPQIYNQIENSNQLRDQGKIKVYSRYTRVQETLLHVGVSIKRCSDHYTAESNIHSVDHAGRNSQRENKKNRMLMLICNSTGNTYEDHLRARLFILFHGAEEIRENQMPTKHVVYRANPCLD